jgi:hypothetical protein
MNSGGRLVASTAHTVQDGGQRWSEPEGVRVTVCQCLPHAVS